MWDVFISHAWEDKETVARPLANALVQAGLSVWYDEFTLTLGDGLRSSIERGLAESRYAIVILSPNFYAKNWPQRELDGLFTREMRGGKTILPVLHHLTPQELERRNPMLADKVSTSTDRGLDLVVRDILRAVCPNQGQPLPEPEPEQGREELSFDKLGQASNPDKLNELMNRLHSRLAANPENGEVHYRLALCYLHLKAYKRAIEHFKRAVELLPLDPDAHYYYGLSLISGRRPRTLSLKDVRNIEEYLEAAIQLDDRPAKYYYLAAILKHDYYLANGLSAPPPSPDDLILMAYRKVQDPGEVERLLQAVTLRDERLISRIRGE